MKLSLFKVTKSDVYIRPPSAYSVTCKDIDMAKVRPADMRSRNVVAN